MKIQYFEDTDTLYLAFNDGAVDETRGPGRETRWWNSTRKGIWSA
jgi:uncharacterized protein YuzE